MGSILYMFWTGFGSAAGVSGATGPMHSASGLIYLHAPQDSLVYSHLSQASLVYEHGPQDSKVYQ